MIILFWTQVFLASVPSYIQHVYVPYASTCCSISLCEYKAIMKKFDDLWVKSTNSVSDEAQGLVDRYIAVAAEFGSEGFIDQVLSWNQGEVGFDIFVL